MQMEECFAYWNLDYNTLTVLLAFRRCYSHSDGFKQNQINYGYRSHFTLLHIRDGHFGNYCPHNISQTGEGTC